jgi:hypothetical protein
LDLFTYFDNCGPNIPITIRKSAMIIKKSTMENPEFVLRIFIFPSRYRIVQVDLQKVRFSLGKGIGANPSIAEGLARQKG